MSAPGANQSGSSSGAPGARKETLSIRQQLRQMRELDDLRKFGLAPLAVDVVTGQEISPNIPIGLSQAPWYYGMEGPTLDHHRNKGVDPEDSKLLKDAVDVVEVVGQQEAFVAGACTNCGSTTHKARDCLLPRRKVGAALTGRVEGVDQRVTRSEEGTKSFSKKRDQWAGAVKCDDLWASYDAKRERAEGEEGTTGSLVKGRRVERPSSSADGAASTMSSSLFSAQTGDAQSVEIKDLPRYLENLEAGAFYDPITRSMRGNPHEEKGSIHSTFRGENQRKEGVAYRHALELQRRFLSGASECIVDLEYDQALQSGGADSAAALGDSDGARFDGAAPSAPSHEDLIAAMLYQQPTTATEQKPTPPVQHVPAAGKATTLSAPQVLASSAHSLAAPPPPTKLSTGGHSTIFGSFFDVNTLLWGYACCRATERGDACQQPAQHQ